MKIFQILNGWCHHDCSREFPNIESTIGKFHPSIVFVEAPDYVFEGWAFDETKEGDARFAKPEAPEGWVYDERTGTFYIEPTPAEQREQAYNSDKMIEFNGSDITVTEAAILWQYYAAEGSEKATELTALIAKAKEEIRTKYPDIK